MLSAFPNLTELEVTSEEEYEDYGNLIAQNEIGDVLRQYGGKLERHVRDIRLLHLDWRMDDHSFGDLSPMSSLRELTVSVRSLLGNLHESADSSVRMSRVVNVLPTSLEMLSLLDRRAPPDPNVARSEGAKACAMLFAMLHPTLRELVASPSFARLQEIRLVDLTFLPELAPSDFPGWNLMKSRNTTDPVISHRSEQLVTITRP